MLAEAVAPDKFPVNSSCFRRELVSLVSETGASEGEKSILIASPEGNLSQCSALHRSTPSQGL